MSNPDVEQFKRDLISYSFHKRKMDELFLELEEINYKMSGAGTIPMSKVAPTVSPSVRSNIGLIERKDVLISEYNMHRIVVDYVDQHMDLIDPDDREILSEKYIQRLRSEEIESKHSYSRSQINRICSRVILEMLKKDAPLFG